jgi:hypothetical protein
MRKRSSSVLTTMKQEGKVADEGGGGGGWVGEEGMKRSRAENAEANDKAGPTRAIDGKPSGVNNENKEEKASLPKCASNCIRQSISAAHRSRSTPHTSMVLAVLLL